SASPSDIHGAHSSIAQRILSVGPQCSVSIGPTEITISSSLRYSRPASSSGKIGPHRSRSSVRRWPNERRRRVSVLGRLNWRRDFLVKLDTTLVLSDSGALY